MDLGVRNELPKLGQDTRYLLDHQRTNRDNILKECDEYEQRANYLKNKIKEIEERIFNTQIGEKIKELVKENLSLSIDAQCLSIELDIYNQGMDRGVSDNNFYHSPVPAASPNHSIGSPMGMMNRGNTPTSGQQCNVLTVDTSTYPYAAVMPTNLSPYPVQQGLPTLPYPMTGSRPQHHLSPHHPLDTSRQFSLGPHPVHPSYYFERQGSVSILNQVPPPGGWMQPGNYPMSPTPNAAPPVPPRPNDLPLGMRNRPQVRTTTTPPNRPVPPPPTPPKPTPTRSPNLERPRSSNEVLDQRDEDDNLVWECSQCTFENHNAMNVCEICNNSRGVGSLGQLNRSPH